VRAFFSRYLDSLVRTRATSSSFDGRPSEGYSFGERYWASLTRTNLPPKENRLGTNTVHGATGISLTAVIERPKHRITVLEEDHPSDILRDPEFIKPSVGEAQTERLRVRRSRTVSIAFVSWAVLSATAVVAVVAGNRAFSDHDHHTSAAGPTITMVRPTHTANAQPAPSTSSVTLPDRPLAYGVIIYPRPGVSLSSGEVHVAGEIQNLPPGHGLWLFVQHGRSGRYFPADEPIQLYSEQWNDLINIGRSGPARIILADLGPQASEELINAPSTYAGFPKLHFAPGITVLDSVAITIA
jgi:hypothetical protein